MPGVQPAFTVVVSLSILALASLPVPGQVLSPSSRTSAESTDSITLKGYAQSAGELVAIQAVDQNTGNLVTLKTVPAAMSGDVYRAPSGTKYKLYPWSYNAGVPKAQYWAPQSIVPNLATSQGHLELSASIGHGGVLETFSAPAYSALQKSLKFSHDFSKVAGIHSDGNSTVRFDQDGVDSGPPTSWMNEQGAVWKPLSSSGGFLDVAWSVGSYTVEGGKKIYALICSPQNGGPYPVVIYNHGGINGLLNTGNLNGSVIDHGQTTQPAGTADDLGQCIDWAKRGWVVAMSSYRGEYVNIASTSPDFMAHKWTSDGSPEFCVGEVTDVLALTNLLVKQAGSIAVGNAGNTIQLNVNHKVFMYGYSHGGCITYRAVEQGASVDAFAVIEGFADLRLTYMNGLLAGLTPEGAATDSGGNTPSGGHYYPDAAGVMGYNWRSGHYFASRGDLSIQKFKTMPIMIFHGDVSAGNPVFLDEPVEIADDIKATKIFVGPSPPTSVHCINGTVGSPAVDSTTHEPLVPIAWCQVSFITMDATDPCVSGTTVPPQMVSCTVLSLTSPAGQPQQLHYLIVYHNMDHFNGGLAIKSQFDAFAEQNFRKVPGCDGVATACNN
jgi:hypothetical protein